jgi:hypothetical protein
VANWQQMAEPTATTQATALLDPSRTIATYNAHLGGPNNLAAFLFSADKISSQNWNANYTAAGAISYIQAGFGVTPAAGVNIKSSANTPAVQTASSSVGTSDAWNQQLTLSNQPTANVSLTLTLTKAGSKQSTTFSMTFTTDNWDVPQNIPLAATLGWSNDTSFTVAGFAKSADHAYDGIISGNGSFLTIATL